MAFVHNGITLQPNKPWTHQDGRQFPARYILDTDIATRESIGVTMVSDVTPTYYDSEYFLAPGLGRDLDTLKAMKVADTKAHCAAVLAGSDGLIAKALDEATSFAEFKAAKPAAWTTYRASMRTVSNTRETEINACTTVEQLRELFKGDAQVQQTDSEGVGVVDGDNNPVMIANPGLATAWPTEPTS
jgi:hypothetical protein